LTKVVKHISTVITENEKNIRDVNYNNDNIDSNMKILTGYIKELCGKIAINDEIANKLINLINIDEDYHQFVSKFGIDDLCRNLTSRTRTYDPKYDIPIITKHVNDINKKIKSIINTINKIYKIYNLPEIKLYPINIYNITK
jgi:Leucine-rich repeat (LRR) protein